MQLRAIDIDMGCDNDIAQLTVWLDIHVKRDKELTKLMKELYRQA